MVIDDQDPDGDLVCPYWRLDGQAALPLCENLAKAGSSIPVDRGPV